MQKYSMVTLAFLLTLCTARAEVPEAFKADLDSLLEGKIIQKSLVDEKRELKTVARAYFEKTTVEEYFALLVDYKRYAGMVPLVEACAPIESSEEGIHKYDIYLRFKEGFVTVPIRAHGYHRLTRPTKENPAAKAFNELTYVKGHDDKIDFIHQTTNIYPYQGGLLIEDIVHLKLKPSFKESTAAKLKQHLNKFFSEYVEGLRKNVGK